MSEMYRLRSRQRVECTYGRMHSVYRLWGRVDHTYYSRISYVYRLQCRDYTVNIMVEFILNTDCGLESRLYILWHNEQFLQIIVQSRLYILFQNELYILYKLQRVHCTYFGRLRGVQRLWMREQIVHNMHNKRSEKIIINSNQYLLQRSSRIYFKGASVNCIYYGAMSCVYRLCY